VRLGKFWYKTLYLGPKRVYGVKSILELIATSVGMEEGTKHPNSLVRAFDSFLWKVQRIDKLRLAFKQKSNGYWEIRNPTPEDPEYFVIEPANPFNNLTRSFYKHEQELQNLKKFAQLTQKTFWEIIHSNFKSRSFVDIFRNLPKQGPVYVLPKPSIICGEDSSYRRYVGNKQVWNENKIKKEGLIMEEALQAIQTFLESNVRCVASSIRADEEQSSNSNLTEVKKEVQRLMSEDILRKKYTPWESSKDKHEDYDVTFTVPVSSHNYFGALKVSFKWD